jgi:hypothetical protein
MSHTFEELKKKTVAELREIAAGMQHEAVQGYTQLNKEHLLAALCKALGIDMHAHHKIAIGAAKSKIKVKIDALKKKREEAVAAKNHAQLKFVRDKIHHLKRELRKISIEV